MNLLAPLRLGIRRRALVRRAARRAGELAAIADRTGAIRSGDVLLFATFRDEAARLPYFLAYYRRLGIAHFLLVDNGSADDGPRRLAGERDVSLWTTPASYRRARFGMDWMCHLLRRHGSGHWCLTVDPDEFLVYPFCDTRPLPALTDWLAASGIRSFPAMLLDMYPRGPVEAQAHRPGDDPFATLAWFDSGNYTVALNPLYRNLWIQGGPRARVFFAETPQAAPALNKIPLVRWEPHFAYHSATHALLPRGLNRVYDEWGGEKASGALLHAKFLPGFAERARAEAARAEHYAGGREYRAYAALGAADFWHPWSERYAGWRQLETLGLISAGNWA